MKTKKDEKVFVEHEEQPVETEFVDSPIGEIEVEKIRDDYYAPFTETEYTEGVVTAKMLAVREAPSINAMMIRVLYEGTKVNYKKHDDEWYELMFGGFCMSKFIQ